MHIVVFKNVKLGCKYMIIITNDPRSREGQVKNTTLEHYSLRYKLIGKCLGCTSL